LESYRVFKPQLSGHCGISTSRRRSVTVLLGLKAQAVNATDEGHSVMCVAVQINDS
jgi:hypothetical protein